MKKKIRILLADDHRMVRQGFKLILQGQDDMAVVGETGNGREHQFCAAWNIHEGSHRIDDERHQCRGDDDTDDEPIGGEVQLVPHMLEMSHIDMNLQPPAPCRTQQLGNIARQI